MTIDPRDRAAIEAQLGRPPRGIHSVGHRCPCGNPDVVTTEPRLEDGTPFPTTFYLTCPRAASMIGTLEASGLMREMTDRLTEDDELRAGYERAHEAYLAARTALQLHGAIGYTEEYDLSRWLLRIRALQSAWGTTAFHRERLLADLLADR